MRVHTFVDETKERGLIMAAATLGPDSLSRARQAIARLTLPNQRSIHFCKERNDRRRLIIAALRVLDPIIVLYDATGHRDLRIGRELCLRALVADAAKIETERLVLELDDSRRAADAAVLNREIRLAGMIGQIRYDHLRAYDDHLLVLPDAIAWSWARGGEWRAMVRPMIREVRNV
ncbi:hypothetical protein [Micromonospora sp. WMMD1082]|uniref:hypothetical protein n=1 Tax=unclassified Micromonospora TaxID=2617518 RepID=UPI002415BBDD|nr:hypothetical protein [Micromonospora sp. WMMD1082]MDG4794297.1 hypothetical protein [Micromonospora sp. WMMD1082]